MVSVLVNDVKAMNIENIFEKEQLLVYFNFRRVNK